MASPQKTCASCNREFMPSSRHKDCPKCRSNRAEMYSMCSCGRRKRARSANCRVCSSAGLKREGNPNWKGGKAKHSKGYTMRSVPDHPRSTKGGYVFEHILVMEESLGRYLLPGENVHHLNGLKSDNRPQNLELWVTNQPPGQRPEDLLEWAHDIIARYGEE